MPSIILAGDSILDNAAYVDGPDVRAQVESKLPSGWSASLLAVDGSYIADVSDQIRVLPDDAGLIIVSAGGNDTLRQLDILENMVGSVAEALLLLHRVVRVFRGAYQHMLDAILATGVRAYVCTIYRPRFPEENMQRVACTALGLFNDVIIEEAALRGLPVIDLRKFFTSDRDYANPIEPSVEGGDKLATVICRVALEANSRAPSGIQMH